MKIKITKPDFYTFFFIANKTWNYST